MQLREIIALAIQNLMARKLRTALNMIGVIVGCTILLMAAAAGTGLTQAFQRLFDQSDFVRQIYVTPGYGRQRQPTEDIQVVGEMSEEKRARIKEALVEQWQDENSEQSDYQISAQQLEKIGDFDHVERVIPAVYLNCGAQWEQETVRVAVNEINLWDSQSPKRVVFGRLLDESPKDEVLVSEFFAYQLGFVSDDDLASLLGKEIKLQFRVGADTLSNVYASLAYQAQADIDFSTQILFATAVQTLLNELDNTSLSQEQKELLLKMMTNEKEEQPTESQENTAKIVERSFKIVGVVKPPEEVASLEKIFNFYRGGSGYSDLFLHPQEAQELQQLKGEATFYNATIKIDSSANLRTVVDEIEAMGLGTTSALWAWDRIQSQVSQAIWVAYGIASLVLFASSMMISNGLAISVIQRTREFGILKSLGARDGDLVKLMLCEGGLIGLFGAMLSVAIGFIVSWLGGGLLNSYLMYRTNSEGFDGGLFSITPLAILITVGLAICTCVLASVLPAIRAARLDPVVAMRNI